MKTQALVLGSILFHVLPAIADVAVPKVGARPAPNPSVTASPAGGPIRESATLHVGACGDSVTLDDRFVYWVDRQSGGYRIMRTPKAGGETTVLYRPSLAYALLARGGALWFTGLPEGQRVEVSPAFLRLDLGTGAVRRLGSVNSGYARLGADGGAVYLTEMRVANDGTPSHTVTRFDERTSQSKIVLRSEGVSEFQAHGGRLFWVGQDEAATVHEVTARTEAKVPAPGPSFWNHLAVSDDSYFVLREGWQIVRTFRGSGKQEVFARGRGLSFGPTLDGDDLFLATEGGVAVFPTRTGTGRLPRTISGEYGSFAADETDVYHFARAADDLCELRRAPRPR